MKAWLIKHEDGRFYTGTNFKKNVPSHLFEDTETKPWMHPVVVLSEECLMDILKELDSEDISAKAVEIYI